MPRYPDPRERAASWDTPTDPLPYRQDAAATPPIPALHRPRSTGPASSPRPLTAAPAPAAPAPRPAPAWRPLPPAVPPNGPAPRRTHGWSPRRILGYSLLATLAVVVVLSGLLVHRVNDFGSAISPHAPFSTQTGYMTGIGRVNLLVMGYGGGDHDGAYLTDSMMVISVVPHDGATTMISVPRDLWVQVPPGSGDYAKINASYQDGLDNGFDGLPAGKLAGGAEAARKVSDVLGIDVSYWLTIDFSGFRQLVDSLGGVDMNVPTAFTARYPRNDNPQIDAGWKMVHFNTGPQHMNGEQAIEYARARYVLNPVSEGTDFARSARQQLLIRAILSRARQPSAWPGLTNATNALQGAVYTNLSFTDLALVAQRMDLTHAARIGLTNQNVLADAQSGGGQDILLPANGDWNSIQQYVANNLKS